MNTQAPPASKPAPSEVLVYRPDIDGIRAVAVLFVVIFHAFPQALPGGFIGVDIFFVISGYLINSIILKKLEAGDFSYREFYIRRIRRIFPALLVTLLAALLAGFYFLFLDEFRQLGKHVAGGAGFVANLVLWSEAGYFDTASETKPLLHLWSLGVEEQFYIFWPLLLGLFWRFGHRLLPVLLLIAVASFSLNIWLTMSDPDAAFYSPLARFWEIMTGGLLAYAVMHWPHRMRLGGHWASMAGLGLIVLGVVFISREQPFPGWWVLLPVAGTVLLILAGADSWVNAKLLSQRLIVWIGLISYPLYLWHWLLLSFARIIKGREPSEETILGIVLLGFLLSWLTYRYIEKPLRFGRWKQRGVAVVSALMLVTGLTGYGIYRLDGVKTRLAVTLTAKQAEDFIYGRHWEEWHKCKEPAVGCHVLKPGREPDIAVIGDSHAGHMASGLAEFYKARGKNPVIYLKAGCAPFYPVILDGDEYFTCDDNHIARSLERVLATPSIQTVILSNYGNLYLHGRTKESASTESYFVGYTSSYTGEALRKNIEAFRKALFETLERLTRAGKHVVFLVDIPELNFNPRECVSQRRLTLVPDQLREPCTLERVRFEERAGEYHELIREAQAAFQTVSFIRLDAALCEGDSCDVLVDGALLYSTRDHLTTHGSRYVIQKISEQLP